METGPQPRERPVVFAKLHAEAFPITLQVHREDTGDLLWQHVILGPKEIQVPGWAPLKVRTTVISNDGTVSVLNSDGQEVGGA